MSLAVHRVLIVDDDSNDVSLLEQALLGTEFDGRLDVVHDGDEAIEYLTATGRYAERESEGWPGLVVLDLKLPGRSGHEIVRWIRWEAGLTLLPIVVLTSSDDPLDIQRAYELGANSYLIKPTSPEALAEFAHTLTRYWLGMNVGGVERGA